LPGGSELGGNEELRETPSQLALQLLHPRLELPNSAIHRQQYLDHSLTPRVIDRFRLNPIPTPRFDEAESCPPNPLNAYDFPGARSALRGVLRAQASVLDRLLQAITGEYGDEVGRAGYGLLTGDDVPTLPAMLGNPSARRARECLLFLADQGGRGLSPSNREIATGIGVTHQPQISRLLSQLVAENLVSKRSQGAGKRNAWRLSSHGEEVLRMLPGRRGEPSDCYQ
jgi:hypothetical protein